MLNYVNPWCTLVVMNHAALVRKAKKVVGSYRKLAAGLGVSPAMVGKMRDSNSVHERHRKNFERVTGGAVRASDFDIPEHPAR